MAINAYSLLIAGPEPKEVCSAPLRLSPSFLASLGVFSKPTFFSQCRWWNLRCGLVELAAPSRRL